MTALPRTTRIVRAVRTRAIADTALRRASRGLLFGAAAGTLTLGVAKLIPLGWHDEWAVPLALGGTGAGVGAVLALARPASLAWAAARIDAAVGLRDRVRAALELESRAGEDPFVGTLLRETESLVESVRPAKVQAVRFHRAWAAGLVLLAAATAGAIFVPSVTRSARSVARAPEPRPDPEAAVVVADVVSTLQESAAAAPLATEQELERLEALERELRSDLARPETRAAAAETAEQIADRARREAERRALADRQVKDLLARLADRGAASESGQPGTPGANGAMPDPASDLAERLASGDLTAARELAQELARTAPTMSEEERARLADQLDALAQSLESAAAAPESGEASGENSPAPSADAPPSVDEIAERLESQGMDPLAARDLAERMAEEQLREQAETDARRDAQELAQRAREAAEEIRNPPSDPANPSPSETPDQPRSGANPQPQPPSGADRPSDPARPSENQQDQPRNPREGRGDQSQPGDRGERPQDQRGERQGEGERGESQPSERTEPGTDPDAAQGEQGEEGEQGSEPRPDNSPGAQPQPDQSQSPSQSGEQRSDQAEPSERGKEGQPAQQPAASPDQRQPGQTPREGQPQPGPQPQPGSQPQPSDQPGTEPSQQQGDQPGEQQSPSATPQPRPGEGARPDPSGMEGLRQTLERMAERPSEAQRQREVADRLQQAADRLAGRGGRPTPDEPRVPGGPGSADAPFTTRDPSISRSEIEDVAGPRATPTDQGGRVAGERFTDRPAAPVEVPPVSGERVREAAAGAERAIEQQVVPGRRSDLVRRVFKRYMERTDAPPIVPPVDTPHPPSPP